LKIERLDGDVVRRNLTRDLGFRGRSRQNIERVTFVAGCCRGIVEYWQLYLTLSIETRCHDSA
jgi:adenylylsulfate kinase-like enzyme